MKSSVIILFLTLSTLISAQTIEWYTFGSGLSSNAAAVAVKDNEVYVGGSFALAGGIQVNGIGKWDGSSWSGLGSGIDGYVNAIAVIGNDVYAAGSFDLASGVPVNNIARWDGSNWWPLGQGVNSDVLCLAADGTDLYAGGFFTTAGTDSAYRIAKWDGSSWSPLGSGINNEVDAIAVSGNTVYAGGIFSQAGGVSAASIAKWDGSSWSPMGNGLSGIVRAISIVGDDVYAGGVITGWIFRWDGSGWYPLGSGLDGLVTSICQSGDDLYVGGLFTHAGGMPAKSIAKFNMITSQWYPIGEGANSSIDAMAVQPSTHSMVIAGSFGYVGNNITANYIASFTDSENPLPVELVSFSGEQAGNSVILKWSTATENNNKGFEVERQEISKQKSVSSKWEKIGFVGGHGTSSELHQYSLTDDNVSSGVYTYRLRQIDFNGTSGYSDIIEIDFTADIQYNLARNFPNPFNPSTTLRYSIPVAGNVKLAVFDGTGRKVADLVNQYQSAGNYEVNFNASGLSSGIYFYRLSAGEFSQTRKLILLK